MKKIMHPRVFDSHGCRDSVPENEEVVDNSIVCSFHRLSIFGRSVNNFILLLGLFLFSNVSIAQTITVDGNPEDWDAENFAFFSVKSYVLDAFGTGQVDNQFTSSKDFFFADGTTNEHLTWVIGQTKAKNDIANAAAVLDDNGILYFAGDRTSNNGDAQIGFWFFLNGTSPRVLQTSPDGGDFAPAHAIGDILILADFTNGGSLATVQIFQWVGTGGNVPNTNGRLNTTSLSGTVAINNASAYPIPDGWTFLNPTYDTNEFYEGQVDLSSLNLTNTCFSSFLLEARASQSVTASLDDFAGGNFNVQPEVSINDVTVCSGGQATFTAVADGGIGPILYSFNGGPFTANNVFTIDPATSSTTVTVIAQGAGPNFCESEPVTGNLTVIDTPEANAGPDKVLTCTTTSIALSGSSTMVGATFSWVASNGGNIVSGADTATPTVNAAGTYTLTVTSPTGNCSDTDVAVVTLNNTPPNADAGADKVLTCTTTSIALSGSSSTPGATFAWVASNGGNIVSGANTATPTVNAAGTYTLTVTNPANGCTATDVALVTLNNTPPNANAGADKVLTCTTTSIALSGSSSTPGATFAWVASNGGNIVSGANTATPTVNAAGTYTLTVTNPANGCTATDVALVTLNNTPPNVDAGADKVLTCVVTSIALSGSSSTPGATFAWVASNGGNIVSGANTATPTVNAAGTYTLTVTNPANGCTATDVALVTLNGTPPNVDAGADKVLTCVVTSIALSGSSSTPGATFAWVASNGGNIVSGANTATPTVNAAGTYTLTVTNPANGCTATDVALVTLNNTPPNVNAGADKVLTCVVTSIALSGSSSIPGATFAWVASNGGNIVSGANTATPTVNAAGTYTLTVTNPANGCTATDVALVTLNNTPPNVNAGADKVLTCVVTSIALSGSSSTPGATFAWVASNGGNIVSGANTSTPTVNAAGTYTLTVTNPANGCTATDVALVTLNNTPPNVDAGADKVLTCTTTSIALSGSSSTPGATFAWVASNGGNIVSGTNTATPTVNAAGTYTLTVTNPANGCTATDVALVTLNSTPPNVNAGADKVLTCTTTSIALSGSSSTPGATFAWVASNGGNIVSGASTATPTVNAAGTYTLTVTNPANGCTATDVALVTLNNTPPNVDAGADKVLTCVVTSIVLSGSSSTPGATFAWVASNGGNIVSGANTATPTVNAAGTYTLTVTNPANGCTATDVALVTLNNTPPNVNAGADKVLTCVVTSISLSGSSSTPGATFAWVASNGGNIVSGANTATPTVNAAGTYTLTVTNPANGCTATDVALATLNNTPPNANAGADKVLTCTTTSIALSGSSSTPGATFAWVASNGGNIVSGANTATPTVNAAGTYTLTVTNPANGCTATDVALVTLNNTPPNANAGPDKELTCVVTSISLSGSSSTPGATFAWVASNGGNIVSGADTATPTVNAVGTYTLTVTNPANGCTATDVALVTLNNTPPDAAAGDDASIECGSSSTSLSGSSSTPGATFAWVASNGGNIISGADTATPTVSAGTYTLTVTNPANGCTASDAVDVTTQSCRTFCTYTQGYYGNSGGIACTPDGQSTTYDLIYNSLLNMPGEYMYLGRGIGAADPGGSFTATPADVAKIIEIMPGGGAAGSIAGDYTPYTVQPLQNGKIRNVLLSQTIALALNLYMPADLSESVGNFSLEGSGGKYLVTAPRAEGSSCEEPVQADCLLQQNAIQSSTLPIPASVIAALPPNPKVWDLFQLAKNALGGLLPAGVTHANISKTVDIINVGFDKCRFFIEFADTAQACPVPEPIIAKVGFNEIVDVEIYPVPFKDNLTMTYQFESDAPVTIEVYDIRGVLLSTQTDTDVYPNKQIAIPVNFTRQQAQMYFVKISTDKGTITKKVISE